MAVRSVSGRRLAELVSDRCGDEELAREVRVVSQVLPFKVSEYVLDELIDWSAAPDDPMYRLVFPHRDMLDPHLFALVDNALDDREQLTQAVAKVRAELNPHPAGQLELNVPREEGVERWGLQHKYRHTMLVFPRQGQTCHSYCGYCFRWAQFVGDADLKLAVSGPQIMVDHLRAHPEITDVLLTGGDPMVMRTGLVRDYLEPLLAADMAHVRTVRIGTKALSFDPTRFVGDADADDLMHVLTRLVEAGKHVAFMLHFSHHRELGTGLVQKAVSRLLSTGVKLRSQAPVVRHVNDCPDVWARMWQKQVELGIHPYYMFVERDTGARRYFGLPLLRAAEVYRGAVTQVSGLGRTARGPVMSATPGKVAIDGELTLPDGTRAISLRFLQARDESRTNRPFLAKWSATAEWWDELEPLGSADRPFFRK